MAGEIQFGAPHEEALALIRGKPVVTRDVFDRLLPELRGRAFTVTGIEQFDTLQRIRDEIATLAGGAEAGQTWDEAKAAITAELDALGEGAERRAELLLRTHGFQAFQAANYRTAMADEDTTHLQYLATEDDRVRDTHLALNAVILPKGDPFWHAHLPPWEWGCRCRIRPINPDLLAMARERDAGAAPDDKYVIEGPAAQALREGTLLRNGRRYDVRPPTDKAPRADAPGVWQWHPDQLRLTADQVLARYDAETQAEFVAWAKAHEIAEGVSVMDWMGPGQRVAAPASPPGDDPGKLPAGIAPVVVGQDLRLQGLNKTAVQRVLDAEAEITTLPHERLLVLDDNGRVLLARDGDTYRVELSREEARMMRGRIVTHNHPGGMPFSPGDIIIAITWGLAELRAVSPQVSYSLRIAEFDLRRLAEVWAILNRHLRRPITAAKAHAALQEIARNLGMHYVVWR